MELRQLRHFVALAESLNFHRAAAALNMTQPPLSLSIRKLEEQLGSPLFERHARGVALTEAGVAALAHAREALNAAQALTQAVRETAAGDRGLLRVGFVGSATYVLIPAVVPAFRLLRPRIDLSLKEAASLEIVRALEDGALDIGLIRTPLLEVGRVALEPLYKEELILVTPRDHPLGRRAEVRLEELREEPLVVYDRRQVPNLWSLTVMSCEAAGFLPKIAEEAAQIHTMIALVESGLGLALAPSIMRRVGSDRVRYVRLTAQGRPLQIGLALATREGDRRSAVRAFAGLAREAAAQFDTE